MNLLFLKNREVSGSRLNGLAPFRRLGAVSTSAPPFFLSKSKQTL